MTCDKCQGELTFVYEEKAGTVMYQEEDETTFNCKCSTWVRYTPAEGCGVER